MRNTKTIRAYKALSSRYIREAKKFLDEGNLTQSSEKLWGAAAIRVKAIAEKRGWKHDGHRELFKIIDKLAKLTGDKELNSLFRAANQLHINFYENWLTKAQLEQAQEEVKKFLEKLRLIETDRN